MPNWGEFDPAKRQQAAAESPDADTAADVCMRVFASAEGRELLRHLYAMTIDKRNRPGATDAELRESEARRGFVHDLERLRDEGIARAAERAKSRKS